MMICKSAYQNLLNRAAHRFVLIEGVYPEQVCFAAACFPWESAFLATSFSCPPLRALSRRLGPLASQNLESCKRMKCHLQVHGGSNFAQVC